MPVSQMLVDHLMTKLNQSPEILQSQAMVESKEKSVNVARYENAPDFFIGFQYNRIGSGETSSVDDGRDSWMIPIKVRIPLWQNRIGSMIAEARNNLKAEEEKLRDMQNTVEYELKDAFYRYQSQNKIVSLYENALIPQAKLAFKSDQAGYEAGKTDILNLIDSERMYLNAYMMYYQAKAETLKNWAMMEKILGKNISNKEK